MAGGFNNVPRDFTLNAGQAAITCVSDHIPDDVLTT